MAYTQLAASIALGIAASVSPVMACDGQGSMIGANVAASAVQGNAVLRDSFASIIEAGNKRIPVLAGAHGGSARVVVRRTRRIDLAPVAAMTGDYAFTGRVIGTIDASFDAIAEVRRRTATGSVAPGPFGDAGI